jgi:hypothetical protein
MVLDCNVGMFLYILLIGANILGVGIMNSVLLERYGENVLLTAWAGSLHAAFAALGGIMSSLFSHCAHIIISHKIFIKTISIVEFKTYINRLNSLNSY